jgi:NAD(P)H dehydrogenase (quinone)
MLAHPNSGSFNHAIAAQAVRTLREQTVFQDPLETIWKNCVFELCGVPVFYRKMFRVVVTSTPEERQAWLDEVARTVSNYFSRPG